MKMDLQITQTSTALLCSAIGVDAHETNSHCSAAAGIIAPSNATAETLIPHEKLREAAALDAPLIAQNRPPAQPVVGYRHGEGNCRSQPIAAVDKVQINERVEYEKEFPMPEGLQYCAQRDTYITAPGARTSDSFAREHYAYRAGLTAWKRRAWKHAELQLQLEQTNANLRAQMHTAAQQRHQQARDPEEA